MENISASNRSEIFRSFWVATWLGWQIESNWTRPFLFAIYSIIKPLAGAAILVVMYSVITQGNFNTPIFPYLYYGNAFYQYVAAIMTGISWSVIDDREHYKTLKYMYIAPINIPAYWLGRGVARFLTGSISVLITIAFGVLFLHVPLNLANRELAVIHRCACDRNFHAGNDGIDPRQHHIADRASFLFDRRSGGGRALPFERRHLSTGCASGVAEAGWLRGSHHLLARIDAPFSHRKCGASFSDIIAF